MTVEVNKQMSRQKISVVIPAFNESAYLADCIESVLAQTIKPYEVIVVDNNSSDDTYAIASMYSQVRVVSEPVQAIYAAVNRGFSEAKGDIIARTDADTQPEPNWLECMLEELRVSGASAITGSIYYYDMPAQKLTRFGERTVRSKLARHSRGTAFLAGANMAIYKDDWLAVQPYLCHRRDIHEDLDLAVHLQQAGKKVAFGPTMLASTSARRLNIPISQFYRYIRGMETVFTGHGTRSNLSLKVPLLYVVAQPLLRLIYISYNSNLNQYALARLAKLIALEN